MEGVSLSTDPRQNLRLQWRLAMKRLAVASVGLLALLSVRSVRAPFRALGALETVHFVSICLANAYSVKVQYIVRREIAYVEWLIVVILQGIFMKRKVQETAM